MNTLYWHDYETFGTNPRCDRACQFAGQRTDEDLNPIGQPLSIMCRQSPDYLPSPDACLVTGITPQQANQEGLAEPEFVARIHSELAAPGTCGVGYNSIRFDDEFTRNLLYRNFHDPYEREYRNGNSRWDIIDVARLCYALRPTGIQWPQHPSGRPSFKLEDLARANELLHEQAHDALSDVQATIGLARLIRDQQPRLYAYCFANRSKSKLAAQLDFGRREPVLHASSMFPSQRGCLAMVVPMCQHPINKNGIIVFDLSANPDDLIQLDAAAIQDRLYTPGDDLPAGVQRVPLKTIHINKAPVITPISALRGADTQRIGLNVEVCLSNLQQIKHQSGLATKIQEVFAQPFEERELDPEQALYSGGFLSAADRSLLAPIRASEPRGLKSFEQQFQDSRFREMLFRYRARHHPDTLDQAEANRWRAFRQQQLLRADDEGLTRLEQVLSRVAALREVSHSPRQNAVLDQIECYARDLTADLQDGNPA